MSDKKSFNAGRALVTGLVVGAFVAGVLVGQSGTSTATPKASPYARLNTFAKVMSYIERSYVDPIDQGKLLDSATKGMVASLDPHSVYLTPEEYKALREETDGEFVGVGLELGRRHDQVRVISPIEGSPAEAAGVRAGDVILEVAGKAVRRLSLREVVRLLKGKKGSKVKVKIARFEGAGPETKVDLTAAQSLTLEMERAVIDVVAVTYRLIKPGYGYIRIRSFQEHVGLDVEQAIEALEGKSGGTLRGLVLDLRNNPGGLLVEAVRVSDLFVDKGLIVSTRGRDAKTVEKYEAHASMTRVKGKLAVLVNRGSASASEIVAAAMKDHGRGKLVGTRTYGKGSVQSIIDIKDGSGLKLTVARYYTPNGSSIEETGVTPDHVVQASVTRDKEATGEQPWYAADAQLNAGLEVFGRAF